LTPTPYVYEDSKESLQEDVYSVNFLTPIQAYTIPIIHAKVLIYLIIIYDNKMYQANQIETANRQLFDRLMRSYVSKR